MNLTRRGFLSGSLATAAAATVPLPSAALLPPGEYTVVLDSLSQFTEEAYRRRHAAKALLHAKNYGMSPQKFKQAYTKGLEVKFRIIDTEDAYRRFVGTRVGLPTPRQIG